MQRDTCNSTPHRNELDEHCYVILPITSPSATRIELRLFIQVDC